MRILYVTRKYPPSVGGMELFAYELNKSLSSKADVRLIKYSGPRTLLIFALPYIWLKAIYALITKPIDIVQVGDGAQAPIGWLVARIFFKKYSVIIHGLDYTYPNWIYQKINVRFVNKADLIFCISTNVSKLVLAGGVSKSKVKTIFLAITDNYYKKINKRQARDKLKLDKNSVILLSVGRLIKRKGVAWFIEEVYPDLIKKHANIKLLVIGEGIDKQNIESSIKKTKTRNYIRLLGRTTDDELIAAYNAADIFVMPNIRVAGDIEGFGLVCLEAAACSLVVIGSNMEGIKDAISDGNNGILINSKNKNEYTNVLSSYINNKNKTKTFGQNSRRYTLSHYSWSSVADKYISTYKELLKK